MFHAGDIVRHVKSGGAYVVIFPPDEQSRLGYCDEPYYVYQQRGLPSTATFWLRRASEMEDGRFVKIGEGYGM